MADMDDRNPDGTEPDRDDDRDRDRMKSNQRNPDGSSPGQGSEGNPGSLPDDDESE